MPETPDSGSPVVVAGGGWAGLAAAVTLCENRVPVVLLESARQLGGRARSIRHHGTVVDNGQHLVIGAYRALLTLMEKLRIDVDKAFLRLPLKLHLRKRERASLQLTARRLPPPLHLFAALAGARGLSLRDRLQAAAFGRRLEHISFDASQDISVQALLHSEGQTPALIEKLWKPLCVSALNTLPGEASARIFLRVLRESLLPMCNHSDLLIPRTELNNLLPQPGADFLEQHGARVELAQRVTGLDIRDGRVVAVEAGDRRLAAGHVILATPHVVSRRLMSRHRALQPLCGQLAELGNEPIATVYLHYPEPVQLPVPMTGFEDGPAHWAFDRRVCGQPGLIAVVISARGAHDTLSGDALTAQVSAQMADCFPDWPAPDTGFVIREKRATFSSRVGIDRFRPANRTPVAGLWLAGDYTDNGLPATLESAVRSGTACAGALLDSLG